VGRDSLLRPSDFDARAVLGKVERYGPRALAFVGKRAAREVLGSAQRYGRQQVALGDTAVWIVPSTSGAARGFWDVAPWRDLAAALPAPARRPRR
jgi:TDG/mug DNA glycosylase family protein